jgi:hypothetical protein
LSVTATSVKEVGGAAFASVTDATVTRWITIGTRLWSSTAFGADWDDALTFWVLHTLASTQLAGGASGQTGAVTGQSVGSVSVSYAGPGSADSLFNSTAWGQLFLGILRSKSSGFMVANSVRSV